MHLPYFYFLAFTNSSKNSTTLFLWSLGLKFKHANFFLNFLDGILKLFSAVPPKKYGNDSCNILLLKSSVLPMLLSFSIFLIETFDIFSISYTLVIDFVLEYKSITDLVLSLKYLRPSPPKVAL